MGLKNNAKKIELLNGVCKELNNLDADLTDYLNNTYDLTDPNSLSPSFLKESINNYQEHFYNLKNADDIEQKVLKNQMKNLDNIIEGQTTALQNLYATLNLSLPKDTQIDNTPDYAPTDNIQEDTPIDNNPDETHMVYIQDELLNYNIPPETPTTITSESATIDKNPEQTPNDETSEKSSYIKPIAIGAAVVLTASAAAMTLGDTPEDMQTTIDDIKQNISENASNIKLFNNYLWDFFAKLYNNSDEIWMDFNESNQTTIPTTEIKEDIIEEYTNGTIHYNAKINTISIYNKTTNTTTQISMSDFIDYIKKEAPFTDGHNKERLMRPDIMSEDSNIYKIILNGEHVLDDLDEPQKEKLNNIIPRELKGVLGITEGNSIDIYTDGDNTILTPENYNVRTLNLSKLNPDTNLSELFTIYQIGTSGTPNIELTTTDTDGLDFYIKYLIQHNANLEATIDKNLYPDNRRSVLITDAEKIIIEQSNGFNKFIGIVNDNLTTEDEKIDAAMLMGEIITDLTTSSDGDGSTEETTDDGDDVTGGPGKDGPGGD